jgi:hypothetical protein
MDVREQAARGLKRVTPRGAKEVARSGFRRFGAATSAWRPLPDYLIIGTKRGGTTSLWKNLLLHPEVATMYPRAENLKSPHYFDIHWDRGERWYRSHFPLSRPGRAKSDTRRAVGEASPYYLFHPFACERVASAIPDVRLLVLLRNPTDRAYSHYRERRREGTEPLSFEEALEAEAGRLAGEEDKIRRDPTYYSFAHDHCSYLARGRYLEHLEPWLDTFPSSSMLILRSEDMYEDPQSVLAQAHEFLGLTPLPRQEGLEHMNLLRSDPLEPRVRSWLDDYYRPHVEALEKRLGRSFHWDTGSVD